MSDFLMEDADDLPDFGEDADDLPDFGEDLENESDEPKPLEEIAPSYASASAQAVAARAKVLEFKKKNEAVAAALGGASQPSGAAASTAGAAVEASSALGRGTVAAPMVAVAAESAQASASEGAAPQASSALGRGTVAAPMAAVAAESAQASASEGAAPQEVKFEDHINLDSENDRLELLRDSFIRQLREDSEHPEPPPFQQAFMYAAAPGRIVQEGSYPRNALNVQLQLLRLLQWQGDWDNWDSYDDRSSSARWGPYSSGRSSSWNSSWSSSGGWGGSRTGMVPPSWATGQMLSDPTVAAAVLPQLLGQLQAKGVSPSVLAQVSQQAQAGQLNQIFSEVAKTLAARKSEAGKSNSGADSGACPPAA